MGRRRSLQIKVTWILILMVQCLKVAITFRKKNKNKTTLYKNKNSMEEVDVTTPYTLLASRSPPVPQIKTLQSAIHRQFCGKLIWTKSAEAISCGISFIVISPGKTLLWWHLKQINWPTLVFSDKGFVYIFKKAVW